MEKDYKKLFTEQINKELYSAYLYLDMANDFTERGLLGFANWFNVQAKEETDHAMLFIKYLQNNYESVSLGDIKGFSEKYKGDLDILNKSLDHEKFITDSINKIYAKADAKNDYRAMQFLDWFVQEQSEEEKNITDLIKKYQVFVKDSNGLYSLDNELAGRVYQAPSLVI